MLALMMFRHVDVGLFDVLSVLCLGFLPVGKSLQLTLLTM